MFRRSPILMVTYTLQFFGDESHDTKRERVFTLAGAIGTDDEWADTIRKWLRRTRGLAFHANKCESEFVKHPDHQKHKDNLALYKDLSVILAESPLVGIAVSLDLQAHGRHFPDVLPDLAYYKCFTDILAYTGEMARKHNADPDREHEIELKFTFDSRPSSDGTAGTTYSMFRSLPEWSGVKVFDTSVSFEGGNVPRLEIPDLLAREAMKEFDRKITGARPEPRRSWRALDESRLGGVRKFIWIEHDADYCRRWRENVDSEASREMIDGYWKWLKDTKRVQHGKPIDNMTNRTLYYAWWERNKAIYV